MSVRHNPLVSVIVPHYRQPDALRRCLKSLARQTLSASAFEVIVVDNNSRIDLTALRRAFPAFEFLQEVEQGAACARNRGVAAATGDILAFIDADCIADPHWLERGVAAMEGADLVGGEIIVTYQGETPTSVEAFERVFAFRQRMYIRRKQFSVTANLFAKRAAASRIGAFRNGISEDVDWCRRAAALGLHLAFNDTSIVSHPARRTWEDLTTKWDRTIRERWNGFGGRKSVRCVKWAVLAAMTALSAAPHAIAIVFSDRISGVKTKAAATAVLARIRIWRARRMLALLGSA